MDLIEKAISSILEGKHKEILIPCTDEKNRNVIRTTAFRLRKRFDENGVIEARDIGITNEDFNGVPGVKIYKHDINNLLVKDKNGEWTNFVSDPKDNKEAMRVFKILCKDQESQENIIKVMEDYNWTKEDVLSELNKI